MKKESREKTVRRNLRRRNFKARKGYSVVEMLLAALVVALIVGGVFFAWRMLMGKGEVENAVKKTQAIVSIIDDMCENNGGVCPAVDTNDITTDSTISVYLPQNKIPYKFIAYSCNEGDNQEVEIRIPLKFYHSDENRAKELCKTAADFVNKNYGKRWIADRSSCDSGSLVITSQHRVCQPY